MKALICGVGGQDGAYLARLLLEKGYEVVGTSRDAMASQSQHGFDVEYERILGGRSLPYWKKTAYRIRRMFLMCGNGSFRYILRGIFR